MRGKVNRAKMRRGKSEVLLTLDMKKQRGEKLWIYVEARGKTFSD
jgi:hypothetical protein